MGGFVFDTKDANSPSYIPNSPLVPLIAQGVVIVAELGCLPDISEEFILDKSKADDIAKSLVIIQAGWLLVQCIHKSCDPVAHHTAGGQYACTCYMCFGDVLRMVEEAIQCLGSDSFIWKLGTATLCYDVDA